MKKLGRNNYPKITRRSPQLKCIKIDHKSKPNSQNSMDFENNSSIENEINGLAKGEIIENLEVSSCSDEEDNLNSKPPILILAGKSTKIMKQSRKRKNTHKKQNWRNQEYSQYISGKKCKICRKGDQENELLLCELPFFVL